MLLHNEEKKERGTGGSLQHCQSIALFQKERVNNLRGKRNAEKEAILGTVYYMCVVYKVYWQSLKPIPYGEWRQDYSCHHLLFWGTERKSKEIIPSAYILANSVLFLLLELYISPDLILYSIYNVIEFIEIRMKHVWISADPPVFDEWYNLHSLLSENVLLLA